VTNTTGYEELVGQFRALVERVVPPGATIAVVSKGDHELLVLDGREAWHFPQRADGVYAGYYPADSANAISHLEAVRKKGAEYIAFPAAAFWWLEEYPDFGRHLSDAYHQVVEAAAGVIYALADATLDPHAPDSATNGSQPDGGCCLS
jgi:hypothetical protein